MHVLFSATTDEELIQAKREAAKIARLSPEEIARILGEGGGSQSAKQLVQPPPAQYGRGSRHSGDFLPLTFEAPRVPAGESISGQSGGQWITAKALAEWYAGFYTELERAGSPPDEEEVTKARSEIEPGGWTIEEDDHTWEAISIEDETGEPHEDSPSATAAKPLQHARSRRAVLPLQYAAQRAPKGGIDLVDKEGHPKRYRGGQFIPGQAIAKAAEMGGEMAENVAKVQKHHEEKKESARQKAAFRGHIDPAKLRGRLAPHATSHGELLPWQAQSAKRSFRALHSHHGDLTLHRLEELTERAENALTKADDAPNAEGLRSAFRARLAQLHMMMDMAADAGVSGNVPGLPEGQTAAQPAAPMSKEEAKRIMASIPNPASLPEGHHLYFTMPEGAKVVPLEKIRNLRARPEGIENAARFMEGARQGVLPKRGPIKVTEEPDGTYTVADGNSTFANARKNGWSSIPVQVVGKDFLEAEKAKTLAKETKKAREKLASSVLFTPEEMALPKSKNAPPAMWKSPEQLYQTAPGLKSAYDDILDEGKGLEKAIGARAVQLTDAAGFTRALDEMKTTPEPYIIMAGVKGKDRAAEKVRDDYGGDWSQIKDAVRASVVVGTANEIPGTIASLRQELESQGWSLWQQPKNRYEEDAGYKDINLIARSPEGHPVELQVNTKDMLRAKSLLGHGYYEDYRTLKGKKEGGEGSALTPEEEQRYEWLDQEMKKLYDAAWSASLGLGSDDLDEMLRSAGHGEAGAEAAGPSAGDTPPERGVEAGGGHREVLGAPPGSGGAGVSAGDTGVPGAGATAPVAPTPPAKPAAPPAKFTPTFTTPQAKAAIADLKSRDLQSLRDELAKHGVNTVNAESRYSPKRIDPTRMKWPEMEALKKEAYARAILARKQQAEWKKQQQTEAATTSAPAATPSTSLPDVPTPAASAVPTATSGEGSPPPTSPTTTPEAAASSPSIPPTSPAVSPHVNLATSIAEKLARGERITPADLRTLAQASYGGSMAEGKYGYSEATDALEAGFNKHLQGKTNPSGDLNTAIAEAAHLAEQVSQLPTQTVRSGEKETHQQFSTPPHYAYAAAWLANLTGDDTVLEPSAGTGCLAVQAGNTGANVIANELSERRAEFLRDLIGSDNVHVENAEQISAILPGRGVHPTAVIMNPPFSQTAGRMGDRKDLMTGAKHIDEALGTLAPGGRLVAIVGRGMSPESPTFREWFGKLKGRHSLRANIGVSGEEYKKYGTHFDTRILVIDKTGPHQGDTVAGDVSNISDLMRSLEGVRNDRPQATRQSPGESVRTGVPEGGAHPGVGTDTPAGTRSGVPGQPAGSSIPGGGQLPGRPEDGGVPSDSGTAGMGSVPDGGGLRDAGAGSGGAAGAGVAGAGGTPERTAGATPAGAKRPRGRKDPGGQPAGKPGARPPVLRPAERVKVEAVKPTPVDKPQGKPDEHGPQEEGTTQEPGPSLYEAYRPQLMRVAGAHKHPTPLVESAAMSAVRPPTPTYQPTLSPDIIEKGMLSEAALESLVYAGQAHQQFLPAGGGTQLRNGMQVRSSSGQWHGLMRDEEGNWTMTGTDRKFATENELAAHLQDGQFVDRDGKSIEAPSKAARKGYFVGDGTGAGKGRQIAGIIADNWNQGRHKHVWISQKQNLYNDAHRDWRDLGNDPAHLVHFDDIRKGAKPPDKGVAFVTYDTLKSKPTDPTKASNLDELVKWLGEDFDGVIAFDEAHSMANAIATEGGGRGKKDASARALSGLELQKRLPNARVVYVSATGATEVSNLAYAERLGIWGRGTPFPKKESFIDQMERGGVAAMEAVAQSLKAQGSYGARSLSFDDGTPEGQVQYERLTHNLTPDQHEMYNAVADGWQKVLQNIPKALESTGGHQNRQAKSAAVSQFWGAQQRFFNQVMTSMQTPSVINAIEKDIAEGKAPVIQIVNTLEAATKRAMARKEDDAPLEDLDVSPREVLMQYLEKSFPVHRHEEYTDDNGNVQTRLAKDSNGEPLIDPQAAAMRDELLDMVGTLRIPESPLDMILKHFGHEHVSEVTGRTQRIIHKEDEHGNVRPTLERRSQKSNAADAASFQGGKKKLLVFSDAGGTGSSYHADKNAENQKQRVHYILQPGWRADNAVQGLGRTHRTNQASAPLYRLVEIDALKAQKRFISTIARRLDQLGALTRGQRQAGSSGLFNAADNLESREAQQALESLFRDFRNGQVPGLSHDEVMKQLGYLSEETQEKGGKRGRRSEPETPPMRQFLNRLLSLRVDMQAKVFDAFDDRLKKTVEQAVKQGTLDTGVENFKADNIQKKKDAVIFKHPESGAEVRHITTTVRQKADKTPFDRLFQGSEQPVGFVRNKQSGRVYALHKWVDKTDARTGDVTAQYKLKGPASEQYRPAHEMGGYYGNWERIQREQAQPLWEQEYSEAPDHTEAEEHFVTGALLPIWDRIPGETPKIYRLKTDDGQSVVGRHVPRKHVEAMLKSLGVAHEGAKHDPVKIHGGLSSGRSGKVTLANGWTLKPVRVQGERRIELVGPSVAHIRELEQDGVTKDRINYDTRFFVPVGEHGAKVLERITANRPITDVGEVEQYGKRGLAQHYQKLARAAWHSGDRHSALIYQKQARETGRQ